MTDRYPISTLQIEGVLCYLTVGDKEVRGYVKFSNSGRATYRVGTLVRSNDLPRHAKPSLWRPVNPITWPDELPEAAVIQPEVQAWRERRIAHGPSDPPTRPDEWPHPGLILGRSHVRPVSAREAEARLLRAIRAFDAIFWEPKYRTQSAWPKDLRISADIVARALRSSPSRKLAGFRDCDYADIYVDPTDVRPLPARWQPTPRDVSDMEANLSRWMASLTRLECSLFKWRASLPSYSFVQIAEFMDSTEDRVRDLYERACVRVFEGATDAVCEAQA